MPIYHAVDTATGQRQRTASTQAGVEPLAPGEELVPFLLLDAEPTDADWDGATRSYVPRPAPPVAFTLSVLAFKARFTQDERDRIEIAQAEHPDRLVRARLRQVEKDMESAQDKQLNRRDPRIQAGVGLLSMVVFEGTPLLEPSRVVEIIGADALGA